MEKFEIVTTAMWDIKHLIEIIGIIFQYVQIF
jgi:hypothetical protein